MFTEETINSRTMTVDLQGFTISLIFLFFFTFAQCQNLVPNGGFELGDCDTIGYPGNLDEVDNWFSSIPDLDVTTPEWFHQCIPEEFFQPPEVAFGTQDAVGEGYAGLIAYSFNSPADWDYREIIGVQLTAPLIEGNSYIVSLKYSHVTNYPEFAIMVNNFGFNFSTHQFYDIPSFPINQSHYSVDTIVPLSSQDEWFEISHIFEADSNYQYLHIGNFFDNELTDTLWNGINYGVYQYYVVDEVSVTSVLSDNFQNKKTVNVYPNPLRDSFTIEPTQNEIIEKVELISLDGRSLQINVPKKSCMSCQFDVPSEVSDGMYLLRVSTLNKNIYQTRIVVKK
jgi:hypothetical protein